MADLTSQPSPTEKYRRPISCSLFMSSPRLFTSLTSSKVLSETESVMSPTSILDSKPFSSYHLKNPFWSDPKSTSSPDPEITTTTTKQQRPWDDKKAIGLGLVDALNDDKSDQTQPKPETRMVVFGSHLKIQIPTFSQTDFGIKTRNSQPYRSPVEKSASGSPVSGRVFTEMELSEDYTCVITHGPNPKTTHIFDNCIVEESSFGVVGFSGANKDNINNNKISDNNDNYNSEIFDTAFGGEDFLSFCCTCKKNLGQGQDIYMYRGEKAFCSNECRYEEMLLEEKEENKL